MIMRRIIFSHCKATYTETYKSSRFCILYWIFLVLNYFNNLCLVLPGTFSVQIYQYHLMCLPDFCHVATCPVQVSLILIYQRDNWKWSSISEVFLVPVKAFFLFWGWSCPEEYTSSRTYWSYLIQVFTSVDIYTQRYIELLFKWKIKNLNI
jgi:hypothetical protein